MTSFICQHCRIICIFCEFHHRSWKILQRFIVVHRDSEATARTAGALVEPIIPSCKDFQFPPTICSGSGSETTSAASILSSDDDGPKLVACLHLRSEIPLSECLAF